VTIDAQLAERIRAVRLIVFDFDGVFTDNAVYVLEDGSEAVRCFRGDGLGLRKLESAGIATLILSTETNPVVVARSRKLGIACIHGCGDKRAALEQIAREKGVDLEHVAFVGNDINDLNCLHCVGLPIVVADAHPDVVPHARYRTSVRGGHGAVREICDLFERVLTPPNPHSALRTPQ
jgi:3-deoxy-D-manno-octulosonate 8-phosphate phosphatase (KDO 8-P phosphatase)